MFQIYCPYCEETRDEEEFHYGGEAHIARPAEPESLSDEEWGHYLFHRKNSKGRHHEMWLHATGCRRFFNIVRNTLTYQVDQVHKMGETTPSRYEDAR